jgi:very-short-patch-repair endonuclease
LLAGKQHGVVGRWQLLALDLTKDQVQDRITAGRLHRIHRGVYAVGHRNLTLRSHWMAAVLACGPGALLSHRRALALWELREATSGPIEVTVPGRTGRRGPKGIRIHVSTILDDADRAELHGIPVTSLARTVLDYAGIASPRRLRDVLEALERRGALIGRDLNELLARCPTRKGTVTLRTVLAQMTGPAPWTQSELERDFLALIRESGLPEHQANVIVEGELVDALWREQSLVVETDGYEFHKSRGHFETDRRRDAKLQVAGYRVLRVTKERIGHDPGGVVADIRALLSAAPASSARADR